MAMGQYSAMLGPNVILEEPTFQRNRQLLTGFEEFCHDHQTFDEKQLIE